MNKPLLAVTLLTGIALSYPSQRCLSQGYRNEKVLYLDQDGNSTRQKEAFQIEQIVQFDDTLWEHNYYRVGRPMMRSVRTSDPNGNMPHGHYITFNNLGIIDTSGTYVKGRRSGTWRIFTPQGRLALEQSYNDGELIWTKDTIQLKNEADSLREKYKRDSAANPNGKTFGKVEIESEFPGGSAGWLRYLNRNLHYPDFAVKNNIQGMVIVNFMVDSVGVIAPSSVYVTRSVEFGVDHEAIRIIFASPAWTPAVQNGKKIKSYKRQPIVFRLG